MSERARPAFCLIIEDDPVVGLGLADALDPGKWYIAGPFKYGRDVLCWLSRFTPDLAVVDLSLADGLFRDASSYQTTSWKTVVVHAPPRVIRAADCGIAPSLWMEKPASSVEMEAALAKLVGLST